MNLVDELHAVVRVLREAHITYAICGGIAVTIHGATRTTKDIDVLIARNDLASALDAIRPVGYEFAALPMVFEAGTPRERHVQRVTKLDAGHAMIVDFILADAAFAGFLESRFEVDLPPGPLMVVSMATLVTMKRLAGRPQDLADLLALDAVKADEA